MIVLIENCFMKKYIFSMLAAFLVLSVSAQKVINDPHAEIRQVPSFNGISISGNFTVILSQGSEDAVAVSAADREDVELIKTEVKEGILHISSNAKNKFWTKNRKFKAYISMKELETLKVGGASTVSIDGSASFAKLKIRLSGASDLKGNIKVSGNLDIDLSGASDININGSAADMKVDLSGASMLKAYEFTVANLSAEASGASTIHITVEKEISARLSGASTLRYKGTALIRDIKTSGASSIDRRS